jgi:hypothetical protein
MTRGRRAHSASDQQHSQVVYQNSVNFLTLFLLFSLSSVAPLQRAFGRHPDPNQQSTNLSRDVGNGTIDEKDEECYEKCGRGAWRVGMWKNTEKFGHYSTTI